MGQGSAMEQGYAGCFKGVGGVFFFSSGVVSGIVQYTIFLFLFCVLDDHCFIIIIHRFLGFYAVSSILKYLV